MKIFWNLIEVVTTQHCEYTKARIVHFKLVVLMLCGFNLSLKQKPLMIWHANLKTKSTECSILTSIISDDVYSSLNWNNFSKYHKKLSSQGNPFYECVCSCSSAGKGSALSAGNPGLIPGLGRSPGEGNGNPLQYPCLENLMDRGAWWASVHGVAKSQALLSD